MSDKFAAVTDEALHILPLAAGEARLASDLWHGSGALVGGLLLQTATLILSVMIMGSPDFSKIAAWVDIVMHGLDLLHIVAGVFILAAGVALMIVAGLLYLVWFPVLARDFFRLARITRGD